MIELSDVHKAFGANRVLRGVNLSIASGTSMVIIGGSGTGKSVLLKCILGLVRPDAGRITLDGQDVTTGDRDAFLARFGLLFQGGARFDSLKVWQKTAVGKPSAVIGSSHTPEPTRKGLQTTRNSTSHVSSGIAFRAECKAVNHKVRDEELITPTGRWPKMFFQTLLYASAPNGAA